MPICGFIHIYLAVYGQEIIVRLREIINLARGFRFLRVFVAVVQTELLRGFRKLSGNFILLKASLFNKGLPFRARPSQSGYM